jgi:hypothetical protein
MTCTFWPAVIYRARPPDERVIAVDSASLVPTIEAQHANIRAASVLRASKLAGADTRGFRRDGWMHPDPAQRG